MAKQTQSKTVPTPVSVADFLASIPDEQQRKDAEQLCKLMQKITGKTPVVWGSSIIGFDQYHYKYDSGREGDAPALSFSPRKANLTIYLLEVIGRHPELLKTIGPHKTGKGCLYIKHLKDVNLDVLGELMKTSYQHIMSHKTDMTGAE